tara:strand:+ start:927 stop:1247 length:321 start_codon:yes stop_codon:yes gene_type:complete
MARTKKSRGIAPFTMRSGNSPMNFLPMFGMAGGLIDKIKGKKDGESMDEKIDEIHSAVTQDENALGEGTGTAETTAGKQGFLAQLAKKVKEKVAGGVEEGTEEQIV